MIMTEVLYICLWYKDKKRTWYMKRPFEKRDFVAIGVGVLLLAVSLTVTILWGRFYNPFV